MIAIIKTLQVILALSVRILVHELGHFLFAKLFGIRVDKFFLFFDIGDRKLLSTKGGWFSKLFPKGKDWETELRQRAKEKNLMDELGLSAPDAAPAQIGKEVDEDNE